MSGSTVSDSAQSTVSNAPRSRLLRLLAWGALLIVMALGFVGYLTPGMRLNWETIASMCGF